MIRIEVREKGRGTWREGRYRDAPVIRMFLFCKE